jgi:hypothetical protein
MGANASGPPLANYRPCMWWCDVPLNGLFWSHCMFVKLRPLFDVNDLTHVDESDWRPNSKSTVRCQPQILQPLYIMYNSRGDANVVPTHNRASTLALFEKPIMSQPDQYDGALSLLSLEAGVTIPSPYGHGQSSNDAVEDETVTRCVQGSPRVKSKSERSGGLAPWSQPLALGARRRKHQPTLPLGRADANECPHQAPV